MYDNNPDNVLDAVKHVMFDENNQAQKAADGSAHDLKFETWCGDTKSFIVSDDGTRYRISVELENARLAAFNTDVNTREQILYGEKYDKKHYPGGYRAFERITAETLQKLVDMKFADPTDKQNCAPAIAEILEYAQTHKNVLLTGYAIDISRDDYRVSIDEIEQEFETSQDIAEFAEMFHAADEFTTDDNHGRAWFD